MYFLVILAISFCNFIFIAKGAITYDMGIGSATWQSAKTRCQLATPRIKYVGTEMRADLGTRMLDLREGEEAWLGYLLDTAVFQYVGCLKYDLAMEPGLAVYVETGGDPGQCHYACGSRGYFGIMLTKCFCFPTMPIDNIHKISCTERCAALNNETACGGNNVVSLYTLAEGVSIPNLTEHTSSKIQGHCILFDQNVNHFHPTICSLSYPIGCEAASGEAIDIGKRTMTWMEMTSFCFSTRLVPFSYKNALKASGDTQVWTGMIKATKIYQEVQGSSPPKSVGYVRSVNGILKIWFETFNPAKSRMFICQTGTPTAEPSPEPTNIPPSPRLASNVNAASTNLLPLYILVPIAVIVILAIIIILVIRSRRHKRNKELKENGLIDKSNGKFAKKKNSYMGSHSSPTVIMSDIVEPDSNQNRTDGRKESNASTGLRANVSLDKLDEKNDGFSNKAYDGRPVSTASDKSLKDKPVYVYNGRIPSSTSDRNSNEIKLSNDTNDVGTNGVNNVGTMDVNGSVSDKKKTDGEYARINKLHRGGNPPPEVGSRELYDNLGREGNQQVSDLDYDNTNPHMNSQEVPKHKVITVSPTDNYYDGLSRF